MILRTLCIDSYKVIHLSDRTLPRQPRIAGDGDARKTLVVVSPSASSTGDPSRLIEVARTAVAELRGGDLYGLKLSLDSTLQNDLGLDSLARVELLHRTEEAFNVRLSDEVFASAVTLRDILAALQKTGAPASRAGSPAAAATGAASAEPAPDTASTLVEVLRWHVEQHPDTAGITVIGTGDERQITYGGLWADAAAICGALQSRGVVAGDAIALMLPTGVNYFQAFIGVLLCGCVPVPIYPPAQAAQLEEHIRRHARLLMNAQAVTMLTDGSVHRLGRLLQANVPCLRHVETVSALISEHAAAAVATARADSLALLQYTSGSTGNPKGVMLTHGQLLANIRAMGRTIRVQNTDIFASWLPLYHDMGLIGAWFGTLYFGMPLFVMSPLTFLSRPERWLWAIHRHRATLSAAPNFAYELCVKRIRDADIAGLDLSSWRVAFNGAEAVLPDTLERFHSRFAQYGFRREAMTPVYGLAECAVGLSFPPIARGPIIDKVAREPFTIAGEARPAAADDPNPLRFVGCGLPLPGYEIRIVDANERELGERQEGRLEFKGPSATQGYFGNPAATSRLIRDGWLDSGDRAYVAGGEIFITGRIKDIVIRSGRHIHPDEIEAAVGKVNGVRTGCVAAFGCRSPSSATERLVIMAETHALDPEVLAKLNAEVSERVVQVLGEPPDEVLLVPPHTVLKTSSGKIRRAANREAFESGAHLRGPGAPRRQLLSLAVGSIRPMAARLRRWMAGILYAAYFWTVVYGIGACAWLLIAAVPHRPGARSIARCAARLILRAVNFPVTAGGMDNIPSDGPCVIVSNHSSYLDGLIALGTLRRNVCFVAKRELRDQWVPRVFIRRIGALLVARDENLESLASVEAMTAAVRAGEALVVFAEGTFTRVPGLRPFHLGGFLAAANAGAPTVPLAIRGTRSALRDGQWFPLRRPIAVEAGPPIAAPSNLKSFQSALRIRDSARAYIAARCGEPDTQNHSNAQNDRAAA
jgi:1-acyl-sn-glycerol-3-phosphate acyltransferase